MKILAATSIRADYDLMSELYKKLHQDSDIDFQLLVYGAHLSHQYGYSVRQIEADQLPILAKVETLIDSDTAVAQLKTASLLIQYSVDQIAEFNPDLILYVGDREDVIMNAMMASYLQIPAIHFWGGDHAEDGNVDNAIRHATAKLANLHFVSLPQHRDRLIKLGENPERIFYVGNMALDRFVQEDPCSKEKLFQHFKLDEKFSPFALLIFHPLPSEREQYAQYLEAMIISTLGKGYGIFISAPNIDPGNKAAFTVIERYRQHPKVCYYENVERKLFYSIYKHADFIIGNSSSGIVEAASIPLPAINVGKRQRSRYAAENVIYCEPIVTDICHSIDAATSKVFTQKLVSIKNPYGDGHSAQRAYDLIKQLPLKDFLVKSEDPLTL